MKNEKLNHVNLCKRCRRALQDEWKYCPACGTGIETGLCPYCWEEIRIWWEYCPYCRKRIGDLSLNRHESNEWLNTILHK